MRDAHFIRQGLYYQKLPIYETDIPYIQHLLSTINQAQASLCAYSLLNTELPITIVDKELMV